MSRAPLAAFAALILLATGPYAQTGPEPGATPPGWPPPDQPAQNEIAPRASDQQVTTPQETVEEETGREVTGSEEAIPDGSTPNQTTLSPEDIDLLLARFSGAADYFTQTDGAALYNATCLACHMPDGRGDEGAGAYPPLVDNPKMTSRHFLAGVILTGYHGMPRFGDKMSDAQVAAVTNYVRSHFGNAYPDEMTPDEVAALRPPEDRD